MAKDLKQGSMHVEHENQALEYSKADGGDYLNPTDERAELLIDAHKNYYGQAAKGIVVGIPSDKLGKQESSTAGEAGGTSESRRA